MGLCRLDLVVVVVPPPACESRRLVKAVHGDPVADLHQKQHPDEAVRGGLSGLPPQPAFLHPLHDLLEEPEDGDEKLRGHHKNLVLRQEPPEHGVVLVGLRPPQQRHLPGRPSGPHLLSNGRGRSAGPRLLPRHQAVRVLPIQQPVRGPSTVGLLVAPRNPIVVPEHELVRIDDRACLHPKQAPRVPHRHAGRVLVEELPPELVVLGKGVEEPRPAELPTILQATRPLFDRLPGLVQLPGRVMNRQGGPPLGPEDKPSGELVRHVADEVGCAVGPGPPNEARAQVRLHAIPMIAALALAKRQLAVGPRPARIADAGLFSLAEDSMDALPVAFPAVPALVALAEVRVVAPPVHAPLLARWLVTLPSPPALLAGAVSRPEAPAVGAAPGADRVAAVLSAIPLNARALVRNPPGGSSKAPLSADLVVQRASFRVPN